VIRAAASAEDQLSNDLHMFEINGLSWTPLNGDNVHGRPPSPRHSMGFAAQGARLFVYGGTGETGGA
jgi:hypothetical protein